MNHYNSTHESKEVQERIDFSSEIISMLPQNIEETAREYNALIRKRGVKSAAGLLQILMIYASAHISIRVLSLVAAQLGIGKISDTAWSKQINKSVLWLTFLLQYSITQIIVPKESFMLSGRNVYLIDASNIRQLGKDGMNCRIHMCYDLKNGRMKEVKVTDHHTAESFKHFNMEKDDIFIADAGYGRAPLYEYALLKEADVIFRITPSHFNVVNKKGEQINLYKILRTTKKNQLDIKCYIKRGKKLLPIRIIISRIPDEKIEKAIKRKKRSSQKRQSRIKPETLEYAKWVILATSLDSSHSAEEILNAYRSRWQVELLFKRFKQHFKITTIRKGSENYALAIVHIWLLIWSIVEKESIIMEIKLIESGTDPDCISIWNISSYAYFIVSTSIVLDCCLMGNHFDISLISKYLPIKLRDRENQFARSKLFAGDLFNLTE